nr:hypothetical protein [Candidatus Sigynarchaeota archaeon]
MEQVDSASFLFNHRCMACGSPIALRHEAIGEAMIQLDALASGADVDGDLCPLYCPACLAEVLEINNLEAKLQVIATIKITISPSLSTSE